MIEMSSLAFMQGFLLFMRMEMDIIYDAAAKFVVLEQFEYHFVVSKKRKLTNPHSAADAGGTNSNEKVGASLPLLAVLAV